MSLEQALRELADHAARPASALPTSCYRDPDYWQAEVDRVLRPGWHAVARTDELSNVGDYRSLELFGEPVVLVRDDEERLRAFSRLCRHRAFPIVEGEGNPPGPAGREPRAVSPIPARADVAGGFLSALNAAMFRSNTAPTTPDVGETGGRNPWDRRIAYS